MDEDNTKRNMALALAVIVIVLIVVPANIPYGGGWEATSYYSELTVEDTTVELGARSKYTYDVDGSIRVAMRVLPEVQGEEPGIVVEMAGPYYLQPSYAAMAWVYSNEPYVVKAYDRDYANNTFLRYKYYAFGYDVTIKTDAKEVYKHSPPFITDYGWTFEKDIVDVSVLSTFKITPWTPIGTDGNWTIISGWSGIMQASCVGIEHGLVGEGEENYGITIQRLDTVGHNLNMYTEGGYFSGADWGDDVALAGVPYMVDVEHGARLGAGAEITKNQWFPWEWMSGTTRNVFVKYTIKIDVLTALRWAPAVGVQFPGKRASENKTAPSPKPTAWDDFLQQLGDAFFAWGAEAQKWALYIIIIGGFVVALKFYWDRRATDALEGVVRRG